MRITFRSAICLCSAVSALGLLGLGGLGGCSRNQADLEVHSLVSDAAIQPEFPVRVYYPTDRNTCDVYLSDIDPSRLSDLSDPLTDVAGNIVHFHIFLMPEAGQTPIDASACNITVRHLILTAAGSPDDGATPASVTAGLYAGGGFCLPDAEPGDPTFEGSLRDATLRLSRATPGFADRLAAARMAGSFIAPRNDDLSKAIAARIESLSRNMSEVRKE